jgi:hypothetical protein
LLLIRASAVCIFASGKYASAPVRR